MDTDSDRVNRVLRIIEDYLKPNISLESMEHIHRSIFNGKESFHRWNNVKDLYSSVGWNEQRFQDFIIECKQTVESDSDFITETYFTIELPSPGPDSVDGYIQEMEKHLYNETAPEKERNGFRYNIIDENTIDASYTYTTTDVNLTYSGRLNELVNTQSIPFRINVEKSLLIMETAYPPHIQKIKGIFRKRTDCDIFVFGNQIVPENSLDQYAELIDAFDLALKEEGGVHRINSLQLEGLTGEIKSIKVLPESGYNHSEDIIGPYEAIEETIGRVYNRAHFDEEILIKSIKIDIYYEDAEFTVTVSNSQMMSYIKLENIRELRIGASIMELLRKELLELF